ncbi:hypothetical protein UUU_11380 [Klebsiella pneumoniae subsp. pneumoniae DSM 30104 = JCM 1662 = NBRC 14940]|nr:hypothetical protein UUU_11380 [Klebsiella pneumoniae subsp. pneumoniae DSM 30104 = JCM 1662 = NBRC 14940]
MQARRAAEDHQVEQRVAAQTVGAVDRYAGDFAYREQARDHHVFALLIHGQRLTGDFGRDTAHHVVTGWDNRDRLFHRIDVGKGTGKFKDTRQTRFQNLFTEVIQFQFRVRAPRTVAAAAFADFDHDGTRHHVTARKVFSVRGITLHKAFAVFVQQVTAFAAATFGNQNPSPGDTGRVELPHFHILHRHAGADGHPDAVTRIDVGVGGGLIDTACAAGRQHGGAGFKVDHFAGLDAQGGTTDYRAVLVFHQIEGVPFGEDSGVVFQVLLIQSVQQGVTGTVSRRRGTRRLFAAEVLRLAAKRALINTAIVKTRERQSHVLQLKNRFRAGLTHVFDGVLVADIVRPFYGVVHMPFPVIFMGVTERDGDATLRGYGMGTGREHFGEQCTGLSALGNLQRRAHTCAAGTDDNSIKLSDWQFHYTPHTTTNP